MVDQEVGVIEIGTLRYGTLATTNCLREKSLKNIKLKCHLFRMLRHMPKINLESNTSSKTLLSR